MKGRGCTQCAGNTSAEMTMLCTLSMKSKRRIKAHKPTGHTQGWESLSTHNTSTAAEPVFFRRFSDHFCRQL